MAEILDGDAAVARREEPWQQGGGPGGPYIAPPLALSAAVAVALAAAVPVVFPPAPEAQAAAVSLSRYAANPFCLAIVFVGFWAVVYGLLQVWGAELERRALESGVDASRGLRRITAALARAAMVNGENARDAALRGQLAADRFEGQRALRAAPLLYAIWALPLLGFIGTVIGISGAIGGLGAVFAETGRQEALTAVLGSLRYAFDTTFLGLAAVLPAMALASLLRTRSEAVRHAVVVAAVGGA